MYVFTVIPGIVNVQVLFCGTLWGFLDVVKVSSTLAGLGTSDPGVLCEGSDLGWF